MSNRTGLGYDHFLSFYSTSSNALNRVIFIPHANNDNSKNNEVTEDMNDKGKSILGAPLRLVRKKLTMVTFE